ncbi:hypothetical protein Poli38472_013747 [Pythium oligandrum]|uniref:Uncharacterized protein n=1 Tax=Pythium oligandrum TaxID=41045 RepID=A0A8K1CD98_PYTOL|nr:hypothetical protein Poli38472_013747 [Pythium oligandrum]|eukprot:TMW61284.1 hypothetical protein Poli38472_013747 [Pythium oligandrum]
MSARPQGAQLLSWEEPVAMLAAGDAVVNGWGVLPHDSLELTEGSNQLHHQEGDQFEDRDDHMGHDEDIFEMEGLHEEPEQQAPASRRRFRTASLNNLTSGREKRTMALQPPDGYHEMPASFVPPHQLVQRDCFSIGLRDEFKRRPTNNI